MKSEIMGEYLVNQEMKNGDEVWVKIDMLGKKVDYLLNGELICSGMFKEQELFMQI